MSRGHGWVERRVLERLDGNRGPDTVAAIANWVYAEADVNGLRRPTSAEIAAVKRALRRLERKGEPISGVTALYLGVRRTYWASNAIWNVPITEPPPFRAKLIKLLAMMSSQFEGERANAAFMVEKLRREMGRTWEELIAEGVDGYAA